MDADTALITAALDILKYLGATSIAGFVTLYVAWISFPPELFVESVVDKSKSFNSESRIRIRNNGKLSATEIYADANSVSAVISGNTFHDTATINGASVTRLSGGESAEISVSPGFAFAQATQLTAFSYVLSLRYSTRLFWFKKSFAKKWQVELRNFPDGFSWLVTPA